MKSTFELDSKFEKSSLQYLLKNNAFEKLGLLEAKTIEDKETQKQGIDLIAKYNGEVVNVDIKAVAGMIPTFSQEIANGKSRRIGWIMNNDLKTDYYLYVWHDADTKSYTEGKKKIAADINNIKETHLSLCSKKELQDLIYSEIGIRCNSNASKFVMSEIVRINSNQPETSYYTVDTENKCLREIKANERKDVYITYSKHINEKPINFVVKKELIQKISKNMIIK